MDLLKQWTEQAKVALTEARQLCGDAHEYNEDAKNCLKNSVKQHQQLSELAKLTASQCARLDSSTSLIKQLLNLVQNHPTFGQLNDLHDRLELSLKRLRECVLDPALGSEYPNLYSFVDDASLEDLKTRLRRVTDGVWNAYEKLSGLLEEDICEQYHIRLGAISLDFLPPVNNDIAETLAELLLQVAQHYDQCSEALTIYSGLSDVEKKELIEILRYDSNHVPSVLRDLRTGLEETKTYHSTVLRYKQNVDASTKKLEQLAEELNKNQLTNRRHEAAHELMSAHTGLEIPQLAQELIQLERHYTQFAKSYYALLQEIHRRQAYEKRVRSVVDSLVYKLEQEQQTETKARIDFCTQYGDYLPQTLWNAVTDPPLHFEIIEHQYTELPNVKSLVDRKAKRDKGQQQNSTKR
ncbi:autophagy associated protein kinase activator Atg17 [Schizosaccharomyces cryophilus OY26]|uniref:Autophagy-related protein 17 n=1 Tax=Schizosaccharomyces cryophilus (strain OY26 / ATCC MYA-4695 / CBS 11777 / NBRC 106824 / NRRL Y48691) TaxID=653667 RepID=S9XAV8_SCHCR|nr:autophagy associated protein kinase activator Atg17 [Schizosaccharomyces cryophilus OY26]EPY50866.1 autophagy associated protein kinase activator Atg17 [Schizosaccharomyces cryophilus OY26]